ncbi:MAG: hypothetical protein QM758_16740 [Armatimonas sp.]
MALPRIPDVRNDEAITSGDLVRLGQALSGRLRLFCPTCKQNLRLTISSGNFKLGTSPNLTGVDNEQEGFPRLVLWCTICQRMLGFVQADMWQWEDGVLKTPGDTRWDRLEIDEPTP